MQGMTSEIQRLNVENEQLRIQLSQHNPNLVISTPQSHHPVSIFIHYVYSGLHTDVHVHVPLVEGPG